jgi:hypothetical protein
MLVVRERHRRIAAHRHEDVRKLRTAEQSGSVGRNRMGMAGRLAMRQHGPAALAGDRLQVLRNGLDRNHQNVALPVHDNLRNMSLKIMDGE